MPSLSTINRRTVIFALAAVFIFSAARIINLLVFGDWQQFAQFSSKLDDLFITGLRFDLKVIAILLLIFIYVPALFFATANRWELFNQWSKWILPIIISLILILAFTEFGYYLFFGTPIDVLVFGLFEDDTTAVISSITGDWRLLTVLFVALLSLMALFFIVQILNRYTVVLVNLVRGKKALC